MYLYKIGDKISAKVTLPSRCIRVKGICPINACMKLCPKKIGPIDKPVIASKNKVPNTANFT